MLGRPLYVRTAASARSAPSDGDATMRFAPPLPSDSSALLIQLIDFRLHASARLRSFD